MNKNQNIHIDIPRWILPNEIVPMSISWSKNIKWDEIRINIAKNVLVDDLSNAKETGFIPDMVKQLLKKVNLWQVKMNLILV
ncbi:MAG: hypothetical protein ACFFDN_17975 [Candidatus Hodarchaeota archaeon]